MAAHSRILAWEVPWTEEPDRLQSTGLQRVGHNLATEQQHTGSCYCSAAKSCLTLCDRMGCSSQASLSFTTSQSLLKFMSIESVMLSNHLILCRPFLEPLPFILVVALEKRECFLLSLVIYKISGKDPDMALLNHKTIFTNPCARECGL